ncbi:hypothetical protein [Photobacterium rosenbergii]|nr:hypothetical protein [Photobacterium rosenbergii]
MISLYFAEHKWFGNQAWGYVAVEHIAGIAASLYLQDKLPHRHYI